MKKRERESIEKNKIDTPNYIGVRRHKDWIGRHYFMVRFAHNNIRYEFGRYEDPKECAKAYDLFVIKNGFDRETNFFKKKLV